MKKIRGKNFIAAVVFATVLGTSFISDNSFIFPDLEVHAKEEETTLSKPVINGLNNAYKGVIITWNEVQGAKGYRIFKRMKSTQKWTLIRTVASTAERRYLDTDTMKDGGLYTYMIQAFDGDKVSEESDTKTIVRVTITNARVTVSYKQKSGRDMARLINDFRTGSDCWAWNSSNTQKVYITGLAKLSYDYSLEKAAMIRAAEIAVNFSHERPNGKDCFSVLNDNGYNYTSAGENIAYGFKSAKSAFKAFQENNNKYEGQGHRRNMLSSDYNVCAIGHVNVGGVNYWVQLFANTTDDSDYTKSKDSKTNVNIEIASEDVSVYNKTLQKMGVVYKDYAPSKVKIKTVEPEKKQVTLTFTRSRGALGYEIYRSTKKKSGYELIKRTTKQNKLTYTDKKLDRKKKYYYYIVPYRIAHDEYVYGKKSDVVSVRTR